MARRAPFPPRACAALSGRAPPRRRNDAARIVSANLCGRSGCATGMSLRGFTFVCVVGCYGCGKRSAEEEGGKWLENFDEFGLGLLLDGASAKSVLIERPTLVQSLTQQCNRERINMGPRLSCEHPRNVDGSHRKVTFSISPNVSYLPCRAHTHLTVFSCSFPGPGSGREWSA